MKALANCKNLQHILMMQDVSFFMENKNPNFDLLGWNSYLEMILSFSSLTTEGAKFPQLDGSGRCLNFCSLNASKVSKVKSISKLKS